MRDAKNCSCNTSSIPSDLDPLVTVTHGCMPLDFSAALHQTESGTRGRSKPVLHGGIFYLTHAENIFPQLGSQKTAQRSTTTQAGDEGQRGRP